MTNDCRMAISVPHMRHVLTEKKSHKAMFLDIISCGLVVKIDYKKFPDSFFLFRDETCLFEYNKMNKYFWCSYEHVWSILQSRYSLSYHNIADFIRDMAEKHFKLTDIMPPLEVTFAAGVEEKHFKLTDITTDGMDSEYQGGVEKHFKAVEIVTINTVWSIDIVEEHFN